MKENDNPLVSVIVPIYNVDKYLNKCVDSILNQSYKNIEVVLVDDGSTDNSAAIADEYPLKDGRVSVFHKSNGGLSDARNYGLDIITGDYVTFIDSDDYIDEKAIELLLKAAGSEKAPLVCMNNATVSSDYSYVELKNDTMNCSNVSSKEFAVLLCEKRVSTSVCNKLFSTDLIGENRFAKGRLGEDFFFLSNLMFRDFKIVMFDYTGYFYYTRTGSITHALQYRAVFDTIKSACELKDKAHTQSSILEKHFARLALYQIRTILFFIPKNDLDEKNETFKYITDALDRYYLYLKEASLSRADKCILVLARRFPKATARIIQFLNKIKRKVTG